jgi:hypothetical protein
MKTISIIFILAGLAIALPAFSADTNGVAAKPQLPTELENFLKNADEFITFFLKPRSGF